MRNKCFRFDCSCFFFLFGHDTSVLTKLRYIDLNNLLPLVSYWLVEFLIHSNALYCQTCIEINTIFYSILPSIFRFQTNVFIECINTFTEIDYTLMVCTKQFRRFRDTVRSLLNFNFGESTFQFPFALKPIENVKILY